MGAGQFLGTLVSALSAEMPGLDALQKQHKDLLVIGVAVMYRKTQEVTDVIKAKSAFLSNRSRERRYCRRVRRNDRHADQLSLFSCRN